MRQCELVFLITFMFFFDTKCKLYRRNTINNGIERVRTNTRIHFTFGLCCHSNETVHWLQPAE